MNQNMNILTSKSEYRGPISVSTLKEKRSAQRLGRVFSLPKKKQDNILNILWLCKGALRRKHFMKQMP